MSKALCLECQRLVTLQHPHDGALLGVTGSHQDGNLIFIRYIEVAGRMV